MPETQEVPFLIDIEHLVKRYPHLPRNAVDDLSCSIRRGEAFGLLGPNGAGKTTIIGVLTTRTLPSSGRATIGGIDVVAHPLAAKQHIAVVPQRVNLDRSLRVREILTYHAAYHGIPRIEREARADALLEELGLGGRGNEKLGWFSGGLEQRVMLARALMHEPEVLFLDEPTTNLDPQTRLFLWNRIRALHERGVTIVLTTHDMEEADRLCERIAILDHGHLLALDTPNSLKQLIPGGTMLELHLRLPEAVGTVHARGNGQVSAPDEELQATFARLPGVTKVDQSSRSARAHAEAETLVYRVYANQEPGTLIANAIQLVIQAQYELLDLHFSRPSLEDVFLYLTGRRLRS